MRSEKLKRWIEKRHWQDTMTIRTLKMVLALVVLGGSIGCGGGDSSCGGPKDAGVVTLDAEIEGLPDVGAVLENSLCRDLCPGYASFCIRAAQLTVACKLACK